VRDDVAEISYDINLHFIIPDTEYVLSFGVSHDSSFGSLMFKFYKEVGRVFKVLLNLEHIEKLKIMNKPGE